MPETSYKNMEEAVFIFNLKRSTAESVILMMVVVVVVLK
jgi:hypothetical protein